MNRKYILRLFIGCAAIGFLSCDNDLDVDPRDSQSSNDFLVADNAIQLVNGVYNRMLDYDMYSFSWIGMTSITSDDADKGSTISDTGADKHKMDALTFEASDVSFNDVWKARYSGIYRANTALYYIDQLAVEESLKNRLIGEVKFLRALWYFDLVRCFGGVPVVVERIDDPNNTEYINQLVLSASLNKKFMHR